MSGYTKLGRGDLEDSPIVYREPEPTDEAPACFFCAGDRGPTVCTADVSGDWLGGEKPSTRHVCQGCFDDAVLLCEVSALTPDELARVKDADLQHRVDLREIMIDYVDLVTKGAVRT